MNIATLKQQAVADRHQLAVLDRTGQLLGSCDSLVPLQAYLGAQVLPAFHIFDGLIDEILHLQPGDRRLYLPMVVFSFENQAYQLSFEFWADAEIDGVYWLMSTIDHSGERLRQIQQDRNEAQIGIERAQEQGLALREYTDRLEQAHQALKRFAYIVSHDLKAPLLAIGNLSLWISEDLKAGNLQEFPEYLRLMQDRVKRMQDLIEAILHYHQEAGERRDLDDIDLRALLMELKDTIFHATPCELQLPAHLPVLHASRSALYQVLSNLLENVSKYVQRPDRHIVIHYEQLGKQHKFGVEDNGPGIDPMHHTRIFEIFQTLQSKDEDPSTGVGLAIVQRIVEDAGGRVWVESVLGQGSTFWFTWPIRG